MGWIIKMLLKLFKPFAKIMIMQAIMEYFTESMSEPATEEPGTDEPSEPAGE